MTLFGNMRKKIAIEHTNEMLMMTEEWSLGSQQEEKKLQITHDHELVLKREEQAYRSHYSCLIESVPLENTIET